MVKYFCDCCGKEEGDLYPITINVHIKNDPMDAMKGHGKMVDGQWQSVSRRTGNTDLCIVCYNKIMYPLWDGIVKLKAELTNKQ